MEPAAAQVPVGQADPNEPDDVVQVDEEENAMVYPKELPSSMEFEDRSYTISRRVQKEDNPDLWSAYYACSHRRQGCTHKIALKLNLATNKLTRKHSGGEHTCGEIEEVDTVDVRVEMLELAAAKAVDDPSEKAITIAKQVRDEVVANHPGNNNNAIFFVFPAHCIIIFYCISTFLLS